MDIGLSECFFLFCSAVKDKVLVICTEAPLSTKYILFVYLKMCFDTHVFASRGRTHPSNTTCSVAIAMMFLVLDERLVQLSCDLTSISFSVFCPLVVTIIKLRSVWIPFELSILLGKRSTRISLEIWNASRSSLEIELSSPRGLFASFACGVPSRMVSRLSCCARQGSLSQCFFPDRFRLFGSLDFHMAPIYREVFVAVRKSNVALHCPSCAESAVEKMPRIATVCPSDGTSSSCSNMEACHLF